MNKKIDKILVSIIVPIYNVEKYLRKCLESIRTQTHLCLEVIMINDGSPDEFILICNEYAKLDSRFILVNKENGGLASARNKGLEYCNGEYIACVDSDDWIEPDMIEKMLINMLTYDTDMSVCSFYVEESNKTRLHDPIKKIEILTKEESLKYMILPKKFYGFSWNKMYKRSLLDNQKYNENILKGEDSPFSCEYILKCDKIVYDTTPLYHYRQDTISISRSKFKNAKMTVLDSYMYIIELLRVNNFPDDLVLLQEVQYANQLLSLIVNIYRTDPKIYLKQRKKIKKEMFTYYRKYFISNEIGLLHKVLYLFFMVIS